MELQKPFIKWVGGKNQLMSKILPYIPKEMENYHEIFLGGGSVLLSILSLQRAGDIHIRGKIYAYDINKDLIHVYQQIQKNEEELYAFLEGYFKSYDKIDGNEINRAPKTIEEGKTSKESYYYWLRGRFNVETNMDANERAALFIFLNKTCFRGMYREGPNGYNVPYGHYKTTPSFIGKDELSSLSKLLQKVQFRACSFTESMKQIGAGDFVYLDPPYAPETKTSFVGYNKDGFDVNMHHALFDSVKKAHDDGATFLMSNAKVELVENALKDFRFEELVARRAINTKNPESTTLEVLITNG